MGKTGLFVEGGGMKCAYGAGVLDVFLDEKVTFDYCMGVSAGAANVASFQAGQRDRNRRFYVIHVKDPHYLSFKNYLKNGNYFGLQYIYGNMSAEDGVDPLDYSAMMHNPAEMYFPATDAETGIVRYFSKEEIHRNHFEPIMATCALPVMCKPIQIDGHEYYDGGVGASIPVDKMCQDGCDRIIAVMSKPRGYVMAPQGNKPIYTAKLKKKYPKIVELLDHRHEKYNEDMRKLLALQRQKKALIFYAPGDIKMKTTTRDPAVMQALYERGVQDAKRDIESVKEFIH